MTSRSAWFRQDDSYFIMFFYRTSKLNETTRSFPARSPRACGEFENNNNNRGGDSGLRTRNDSQERRPTFSGPTSRCGQTLACAVGRRPPAARGRSRSRRRTGRSGPQRHGRRWTQLFYERRNSRAQGRGARDSSWLAAARARKGAKLRPASGWRRRCQFRARTNFRAPPPPANTL